MRLRLRPAPQLQTQGASANRGPSVSQIRPAKSANVAPSKCDLLLPQNSFQFHSSQDCWYWAIIQITFSDKVFFTSDAKHLKRNLLCTKFTHGNCNMVTIREWSWLWFLYVLLLLEMYLFFYKITGVSPGKTRWRSAPPFLTQSAENGIRPLPKPPLPFLHWPLLLHKTLVTSLHCFMQSKLLSIESYFKLNCTSSLIYFYFFQLFQ